MKRGMYVFCAVFLAVFAAAAFCAVSIHGVSDEVVFTVTDHYGSRGAVEDVTIKMHDVMNSRLVWDVSCEAGERPETEADFRFYYKVQRWERESAYAGVYLSTSFHHDYYYGSIYEDAGQELHGATAAVAELAESVGPGEEKSRVFRMGDYYDYYPLSIEIDLPAHPDTVYGSYMNTFSSDEYLVYGDFGADKGILIFEELFKIPVLEDEHMEFTVGKHDNGSILHVGSHSGMGLPGDSYYMHGESVVSPSAVYFWLDPRTVNGDYVDTSELGLEFGIYRLPYGYDEEKKMDVAYEELHTFFPLELETVVSSLHVAGERLLMLTEEGAGVVLTAIDLATGETLQRIVLREDAEWINGVYVYDGFIVIWFPDELQLYALLPDGSLEHRFTVPEALYGLDVSEHEDYYNGYISHMAYDGEKLVIAGGLDDEFAYYYPSTSFYLAAYDETGLLYFGTYRCSLSGDYLSGNAYKKLVEPREIRVEIE